VTGVLEALGTLGTPGADGTDRAPGADGVPAAPSCETPINIVTVLPDRGDRYFSKGLYEG
jgi:cysteine synthase